MVLWLETFGIFSVAMLGIVLGLWASKQSMTARLTAMAAAFLLVGMILLGRRDDLWENLPFLCPLAAGRIRFVILAFAVTLGLSAPLDQLTSRISRFATCLVMCLMISVLISLPFLLPAVLQERLTASQTRFDINGICRQTLPYTCGPAAAVTALNRLGFEAAEGTLALQARTGPVIGTSPWDLYRAIEASYSPQGLICAFEHVSSLEQIPHGGILLAIVNDRFAVDHCVAVLGFDEQTVTLADPAEGLIQMPRPQFIQQWRNCGILLHRPL